MNYFKLGLITCSIILCLSIKAGAFTADSLILHGIGIDSLKIGATYEISLRSRSCFSNGLTILTITKDECGYHLTGRSSTTNKFVQKKQTIYNITGLSREQLDSIRSFELMLSQLIDKNDLSGGHGCTAYGVFSIKQDGKMINYTELSCESILFPKLLPLLIEIQICCL